MRSRLVLIKYESQTKIYYQIDEFAKDSGPVITMPLGPNLNSYDMIPLENNRQALRIFFRKGSIIVMDGEARYLWAHSIPLDFIFGPNIYSIVLFVGKYMPITNCFYSDVYNNTLCYYYDNKFFSKY